MSSRSLYADIYNNFPKARPQATRMRKLISVDLNTTAGQYMLLGFNISKENESDFYLSLLHDNIFRQIWKYCDP